MQIQSQPHSASIKDVHELHRGCCSDDPSVYNAAFQQLGQFLLRVAHSKIGNQPHLVQLAEDCSQQALAVIWKKLRDGNGPDHVEWFMTWCASIVIHKVLDELRRLARSHTGSLEEQSADDPVSSSQRHGSPPKGPEIDPESYTLNAQDKAEFISLIQNHPELSTEAKFILLYGYLLEVDDEELAIQLGKKRATVRVLRFRGLKLLRGDQEFMTKLSSFSFAELA